MKLQFGDRRLIQCANLLRAKQKFRDAAASYVAERIPLFSLPPELRDYGKDTVRRALELLGEEEPTDEWSNHAS